MTTMLCQDLQVIVPDWDAPAGVKALSTTRIGGFSPPPFASLNLGLHVGDQPTLVQQNRDKLQQLCLPTAPVWLEQVHGCDVLDLGVWQGELVKADAVFSASANQVCAVMTADCLPVLFCNKAGTQVAAAHAGWRGLAAGVLEQTLATFADPAQVIAWLGPAIGPSAFEVGVEVRDTFLRSHAAANQAFVPTAPGKYLANLYLLARQRLLAAGVTEVSGGQYCTYTQSELFFSYRRAGQTGRMASLIWLQ